MDNLATAETPADNVELFVCGVIEKIEDVNKFSYNLVATNNGIELVTRSSVDDIGNSDYTVAQKHINSSILAMSCVKPESRKYKTTLYCSQQVIALLEREDGGWISKPKTNVESIDTLRSLYCSFDNIQCQQYVKSGGIYDKCLAEIRKV